MEFFGCFSRGFMEFSSPGDHGFKELRGFSGMELGFFRVAKSSGGGRLHQQNEELWSLYLDSRTAKLKTCACGNAARWNPEVEPRSSFRGAPRLKPALGFMLGLAYIPLII